MIELNGNQYGLCLVDTNAASEMSKYPAREFRNFLEWSLTDKPTMIPCFSMFTIMELRRKPTVYEQFLETFSPFPIAILKSHEQLLAEEVDSYPNPMVINPILHAFTGLASSPDNRMKNVFDKLFDTSEAQSQERMWLDGRDSAIAGMLSLVKNYPPEENKYTSREIRTFLEIAVIQQLASRFMQFAKSYVDADNAINIDAFPSLKISLFTAFYKFYVDNRRPSQSDVFDIVIAAPTPYVDAVITERHQAEVLRKIKRRDEFIEKLQVFILKDFRSSRIETAGS